MTMMEESTNVDIEQFNFDSWCGKLNLSRKVIQILRNEELCTKDALELISESDLKSLGLPLGCVKLIIKDIQTSTSPSLPETPVDAAAPSQQEELLEAGNTLDSLLANSACVMDKERSPSGSHMDPRAILTMKATTKKATHITQFLTEKCKRRRQNKRREFVLRSGQGNTETLVLKTDEEHPYLGIYVEEWGAANMRLLNFLLSSGMLQRQDVEYYLAYTTRIFEFAELYEWNSVLHFDYSYRELQAEHGFKWGTFSPHMELQILIPKRHRDAKQPGPDANRYQSNNKQEDCRIFKAKGNCPFGDSCRYRHSKLEKSPNRPKTLEA